MGNSWIWTNLSRIRFPHQAVIQPINKYSQFVHSVKKTPRSGILAARDLTSAFSKRCQHLQNFRYSYQKKHNLYINSSYKFCYLSPMLKSDSLNTKKNHSPHEKWSFPLRITSENMQYSGVNSRILHVFWGNP